MEAGIGLDQDMGIFTELGILYAYHKREKLHEHLKLFSQRINIPKLIRVCEVHAWDELCFLYVQYDEYDNAAEVMMKHPDAWEHPIQGRVRQTLQCRCLLQSDPILSI